MFDYSQQSKTRTTFKQRIYIMVTPSLSINPANIMQAPVGLAMNAGSALQELPQEVFNKIFYNLGTKDKKKLRTLSKEMEMKSNSAFYSKNSNYFNRLQYARDQIQEQKERIERVISAERRVEKREIIDKICQPIVFATLPCTCPILSGAGITFCALATPFAVCYNDCSLCTDESAPCSDCCCCCCCNDKVIKVLSPNSVCLPAKKTFELLGGLCDYACFGSCEPEFEGLNRI